MPLSYEQTEMAPQKVNRFLPGCVAHADSGREDALLPTEFHKEIIEFGMRASNLHHRQSRCSTLVGD